MAKPVTNETIQDEPIVQTPAFVDNQQVTSGLTLIPKVGPVSLERAKIGGETTLYTVNNNGIFSFGDGSDGALTTTGNVTLTADKYYTDLTINSGHVFSPAGYRIFVTGKLTVDGTISRNGNAGSSGSTNGTGGAGGSALADGYLKGSLAGGAGGTAVGAGAAGGNTSNSIGGNGSAGGAGGPQENPPGGDNGAGGVGGTATGSNVKLIANWHLATLLDIGSTGSTIKFDNSAGAGGGGSGGRGTYTGSGGGGGGSAGGVVAIYARNITIAVSGSITANGGNGGDGAIANVGIPANTDGGGGGGGGGGNGGQVILVYNTLVNNGNITTSGGTGGTGGSNNGGAGSSGQNGSNGTAGTIRQFQLSL